MDAATHNKIVSFIWGIADDCLRDIYVKGKYRDVILPMVVIRRLDAVLEDTKKAVLEKKKFLDEHGITNYDDALRGVSGQTFYNKSPFRLRDLTSADTPQKLRTNFEAYLDGFSPNVQEILDKFKFRAQIATMTEAGILGSVIEKYISKDINLSPNPIYADDGETVLLPALDNHAMGTIFEELVRKFNEDNNEEAGEHWTPRDVVSLMADLIFAPVAEQIKDAPYTCYDGACGTGGMLTVAQERISELTDKNVQLILHGQEINGETFAIARADMLMKGNGSNAANIMFGSTLSDDKFSVKEFDFMLSNPPYGKSWKAEIGKMGAAKKEDIADMRFNTSTDDGTPLAMLPKVDDGQLLFLLNNVSKMKSDFAKAPLGSRIAEVHSGSSLFTGKAGSGESNARRYMLENDLVEAIIALPENMFYNTGIATYIWVLSNRKEERRAGKIQLIDASAMKSPLRKNLGKKNCEFTEDIRSEIMKIFMSMEESERSKVFPNSEFGYWHLKIQRPKYNDDGTPMLDKKKRPVFDKDKEDEENVPFSYEGGIDAFMKAEVLPYAHDAVIGEVKIGYEISFTKYFYKPSELRPLSDIVSDLRAVEAETEGALNEILGGIAL